MTNIKHEPTFTFTTGKKSSYDCFHRFTTSKGNINSIPKQLLVWTLYTRSCRLRLFLNLMLPDATLWQAAPQFLKMVRFMFSIKTGIKADIYKQSRLPAKHDDDDTTAATFFVEFYACSKWLMCCLQLCPFSFCRAPSMDRRVQLNRSAWAPLWGWWRQVGDFQISRQERSCFMTFSSKSDGHGFLIPTWEHVCISSEMTSKNTQCSFLCYPVQSATDLYRRDLTDQ